MNMKVRRVDCPRSAQSYFALLLGELAASQKASYAVAYVAAVRLPTRGIPRSPDCGATERVPPRVENRPALRPTAMCRVETHASALLPVRLPPRQTVRADFPHTAFHRVLFLLPWTLSFL